MLVLVSSLMLIASLVLVIVIVVPRDVEKTIFVEMQITGWKVA